MLERLTTHWWIPVVRGCFGILFGLLALVWPHETLVTLILLFGAFCFVDGIFAVPFLSGPLRDAPRTLGSAAA